MENLAAKITFLKSEYIPALMQLDEATAAKWGKMNVRQMIEHMADYVRIASGRTYYDVVTPTDQIPKMQAFLMSEKPFRENTPNPLMPEVPVALKHAGKEAAIEELQNEINHFFEVYQAESDKVTANPFFGMLEFDQQVQLLHKHATHHLRQFGGAF